MGNRRKTDNRKENLRWATRKEQSENRTNWNRAESALKKPILAKKTDCHKSWIPFVSTAQAADALNLSAGNIWSCLHGRRQHVGGFVFKFDEIIIKETNRELR